MVSPQNQAVAARSAMAMKGRGEEPTYAKMVAACPGALRNPKTCEPVGKKRVYNRNHRVPCGEVAHDLLWWRLTPLPSCASFAGPVLERVAYAC